MHPEVFNAQRGAKKSVNVITKEIKKMRKRILLAGAMILILPAVFLTASCAKKEMQTDPVSMSKPEIRQAADTSGAKAEQAKRIEEEQLREERLRQEAAARDAAEKALVNENIHFAFNSDTLTGQAQRLLNSKAGFLRTHSNISVTVEGHCDDRGSESYNMALGKRRAEAVKKFLVDQGISTDRLVTVSYGENKPIALGRDEASWAKNRRAQLVITLNSAYHKSAQN